MSVDSDVTEIETDESAEVAHQALVGLCNQLVDQIAAGRAEVAVRQALALALSAPPPAPPREWRDLGPAALGFAQAANPDLPVTPDRRGGHFCDICGCADEKQIQPGPDAEHFGADKCAWMCKDENERACEARKIHRYPPRPDLVPDAVLAALSAADEAHAARHRQQPAAQQQSQQEPAQQYAPPGWQDSTANGVYDVHGQWHPPVSLPVPQQVPAWHPMSHTIAGGAHMGHAISGGAHMGHAISGVNRGQPGAYGAVSGQQSPQAPPGTEVPPGQQRAVDGFYEAARGATEAGADVTLQAHPDPAASPQRPPRDRYGNRRYPRRRGR